MRDAGRRLCCLRRWRFRRCLHHHHSQQHSAWVLSLFLSRQSYDLQVQTMAAGEASTKYIAALDVGTTTIRCIITQGLRQIGAASAKVHLIYPKEGYVEICPNELWDTVITVIKTAISNAKLTASDVSVLGISTQRATFITWHRTTGEYFHNFITWKDVRTTVLAKEINHYWSIKAVRWACYAGYYLTGSTKCLLGSKIKFASNHVSVRLAWALKHIQGLQEALQDDNVSFGTMDTWLLHKFNGSFVTDITNASATALYDPFTLDWSVIPDLLQIPRKIFPQVVDNDYNFGYTNPEIFGHTIKIGVVISDQSASMFGSCCFNEDDLKLTIGTGGFLNINTANKVQPSGKGMYPLIAWRLNNKLSYLAEVPCNDVGSLIEWAIQTELITNPAETSSLVQSVPDNDGVYFIAAFSGLGAPINNETAASGFFGIKPTTTKVHLVRAVLESIVFRVALAFDMLKKERLRKYHSLRVDGGVSRNDFICQLIADVTGLEVERFNSPDISARGVCYLAGLSCGIWNQLEDLHNSSEVERCFSPNKNPEYQRNCRKQLNRWLDAANRFKSWYTED